MKKRQRRTNGYNTIAEGFIDFLGVSNEKEILTSLIAPLVEKCDLIVDIGAGTGEITSKLLSPNNKVVAIEPCGDYISYLRRSMDQGNFEIIPKKIEDVELPHSSVDAILFSHSLSYVDDYQDSIQKTLTWLKPCGVGIYIVLSKKGDQSDLMRRYWNHYHSPNDPLRYPYADLIKRELGKLSQKVSRRKVVTTIKTSSDKLLTQLAAFILEIPLQTFKNGLDSNLKNFFARKKRNGYYHISTGHEVVFFNKNSQT